jgi:L,D-transpeptidase ErfK/SrfK
MRPNLCPLSPAARLAVALVVAAASNGCGPVRPSPEPPGTEVASAPRTSLLLKVGERRLYLMDDDPVTPVESFPIAVGRAGHETPPGHYRVEEKIEHPHYDKLDPKDRSRLLKRIPPGPHNPLGERWIGIILGEGWTIGIHGTPNPELLGKAVSGGCIRMRNADVVRVYDRVQLGTPVVVEP